MKRRSVTIDGKHFTFTPGTDEQVVFKEVLVDWCYPFNFSKDDVILNLGGHIGSFEVYCFNLVKEIVTFEPSEENRDRFAAHMYTNEIGNVTLFQGAIARHNGECDVLIGDLGGHNSLVDIGEKIKEVRKVKCWDINDVLSHYKPNRIKCDIEGYEYQLFSELTIQEYVEEMWLETHTFTPSMHLENKKLMQAFKNQGFVVEYLENDPYNRTYLVHCTR